MSAMVGEAREDCVSTVQDDLLKPPLCSCGAELSYQKLINQQKKRITAERNLRAPISDNSRLVASVLSPFDGKYGQVTAAFQDLCLCASQIAPGFEGAKSLTSITD
ncbi:hypothetical protein PC118_g22642 [Phytophthora cactorum]|uniref:Uncharacterized protein n=1 Tax=Phytophthora cactorum TaxID=29920 RepID=A0A8T1ESQ5_9STRA|nr:hypothetical protein PC118_g22642 [Phytophthora cactorum]